jgi:hypothetical protein
MFLCGGLVDIVDNVEELSTKMGRMAYFRGKAWG